LYSPTWKFIYRPVPVLQFVSVIENSIKKLVTLTAKITDSLGNGIGGRAVFFYDKVSKGYAVTNSSGMAVKTITGIPGSVHTYQVQFRGDAKYSAVPMLFSIYTTLP
ncbi:MAG: Ig-like domain-containing protein, partial [Nitrospirota bacterium]